MSLKNATQEEIIDVLLTAIDAGDWHSPSVRKLLIKEHTEHAIYGEFESSLHNTYWDSRCGFNINKTSLHVWNIKTEVDETGVKERNYYKPIYNFQSICKWLSKFN